MRSSLALILLSMLLVFAVSSAGETSEAADFSYVGVATCGMCHKSAKQGEQLKAWQESAHAQAYAVLQSAEADKVSQEKGFGAKAVEAEGCLKCHATGHNLDKSLLGAKFKIEEGVQCETCHGPGSAYKTMKIMKDQKLAVENGLQLHENVEQFCKTCHNPESPTYKPFDFEKMWAKIQHPVPK